MTNPFSLLHGARTLLHGASKLFDFDDFQDADTMLRVTLILCICLFVALIAGTLIAYFVLRARGKRDVIRTRDVTYGAICLAASYALSFLGIGLPYGGTITFASVLPVMIYCYYFGFFKGLVITVAYTILQFFQSPYIVHPMSAVLDYVIPYLSLVFLGLFSYRQSRYNRAVAAGKHVLAAHIPFFLGVACYFALRYASHVLSGVIFYGDYIAWEGWWQQHLVVYSFAYNGVFFIPDTLIALGAAIGVLSSKSFNSFMATSAGAAEGVRSTGAADILYESGADVTAPADTLQNSHAAAENDERTAPCADER